MVARPEGSGSPSSQFAPPPPSVPLAGCPVEAGLGTLGRKWTLNIIRDLAFYPGTAFTTILKNNPGLRQRTLSLRLRQLVADGLVQKEVPSTRSQRTGYDLTAKGREVWPVLAALAQFGMRNHPEKVFADGRSRDIEEVYPNSAELMLDHIAVYARKTGFGLTRPSPGVEQRDAAQSELTLAAGIATATRRRSTGRESSPLTRRGMKA